MAIPTYEELMLPVLTLCSQKVWVMRELITWITDDLHLNEQERDQTLPSGRGTIIASRVHWAKTYLKQAGLLEQPKRGLVQITSRGQNVLAGHPAKIDSAFLRKFDGFRAFLSRTNAGGASAKQAVTASLEPAPSPVESGSTPEEQIASASLALDEAVRDALLARILDATPKFFEGLIIDVLLSMGYGGSRADAGEQLGGTGDGGVDGVIREDQLGLERIYLQAKRYQVGNTVGSEAVHAFMGALVSKGAQKGVFITTGSFSKQARLVANQPGHLRLVLIDGDELTGLMVRFGVGVRTARIVEIKRVDLDYFEDPAPE